MTDQTGLYFWDVLKDGSLLITSEFNRIGWLFLPDFSTRHKHLYQASIILRHSRNRYVLTKSRYIFEIGDRSVTNGSILTNEEMLQVIFEYGLIRGNI